jgi:hypothetical protein
MMRTILAPAVLAALLGLATSSTVHAYGTCSRSASYSNPYTGRSGTATANTSYGPNGVTHSASASGSGPNGSASGSRSGSYSPTMYNGYSGAGSAEGYRSASVVRYP